MRASRAAMVLVAAALVVGTCASDDGGVSLDREIDEVRTRIASCRIIDFDDGRRHNVTVEIYNQSDSDLDVTVALEAEGGLTGTSETFAVPAGGSNAFPVVFDQTATEPAGELECDGFLTAVDTRLEP